MPPRKPKAQETYKQRSYRTSQEWTPARIRAARGLADGGHLYQAADLVEAMKTDERITGVLSTRLRGLLKFPLTIYPGDGEKGDESPQTKALEDDFWTAYPEHTLQELMAWGTVLGIGVAQQTWELKAGRLLPSVRVWNPRWLRWEHRTETWQLETENAGIITIEPGDGTWILYTPYGEHRPWKHGIWQALAPWWLLKRYAQQDWGTYSEAHGQPLRVGTAPAGSTKPDREELAADLQDMAGVTGIALPEGFDIKLVEATARTWETFKAQIEAANAGMAIAIAGQTLTTEVKGGSLAAAEVHDNVRHDLIESDQQTLSTTVHDQSLTWWAIFNFGSEDLAPWAEWDTSPPEDLKAKAETQRARAEALTAVAAVIASYVDLGIELDLERLAEEFDLPVRDLQALAVRLKAAADQGDRTRVALANARAGERVGGFVRGQLYVDRLQQRALGAGLEAFQANLQQLTEFIRNASSYEEIAQGLPRVFEGMDPDDAAGLYEALMLADLAGRKAVLDDL
jgi:phage gp29-like protein